MRNRLIVAYAATLAYSVIWFLLGPSNQPHRIFLEGGPIDWLSTAFLATAAILAGRTWMVSRGRGGTRAGFWLLSCAGLCFLVLDERFQLHEGVLSDLQSYLFGDVGVSNWNNLLLLVYGAFALLLFAIYLPTVRAIGGFWPLLAVVAAFYASHATFDLLTGSPSISTKWRQTLEETSKLLAGLSLMLAYLQAAVSVGAGRDGERGTPRRIWPYVAFVAAMAVLTVAAVLFREPWWSQFLESKWGDPVPWVASVYLAVTSLLIWLASPPRSDDAGAGTVAWQVAAGASALLAFDLSTVACAYRFNLPSIRAEFPAVLHDGKTILQSPGVLNSAVSAGMVALLGFLAWRARRVLRDRSVYLSIAAAVLLVRIPLLLLAPGYDAVANWMLLVACGSLALAAWSRFGDRLA